MENEGTFVRFLNELLLWLDGCLCRLSKFSVLSLSSGLSDLDLARIVPVENWWSCICSLLDFHSHSNSWNAEARITWIALKSIYLFPRSLKYLRASSFSSAYCWRWKCVPALSLQYSAAHLRVSFPSDPSDLSCSSSWCRKSLSLQFGGISLKTKK